MKISAKCDYALRAMLELALRHGKGASNIHEIARKQNIPKRYLEHLLLSLKKYGLVDSYRGKQGGYSLAKHPGDIRVGEIVEAVEGPIDLLPKRRRKGVKKDIIFDVWATAQKLVTEVLNSITLEELANKRRQADRNYIYNI